MRKSARPKATYAEVTAADLKPHVEAALFATGKPLSLDELAELLNEGKRKVQNALDLLVADYAGRAGSATHPRATAGASNSEKNSKRAPDPGTIRNEPSQV